MAKVEVVVIEVAGVVIVTEEVVEMAGVVNVASELAVSSFELDDCTPISLSSKLILLARLIAMFSLELFTIIFFLA